MFQISFSYILTNIIKWWQVCHILCMAYSETKIRALFNIPLTRQQLHSWLTCIYTPILNHSNTVVFTYIFLSLPSSAFADTNMLKEDLLTTILNKNLLCTQGHTCYTLLERQDTCTSPQCCETCVWLCQQTHERDLCGTDFVEFFFFNQRRL